MEEDIGILKVFLGLYGAVTFDDVCSLGLHGTSDHLWMCYDLSSGSVDRVRATAS